MPDPSAFSENLKLLCSYCTSVASVCRDIGISRQQFTKYLSGKSTPSLYNFRRISDYFGVEESELLLPPRDFRELIALRPPSVPQSAPMQDFIATSLKGTSASRRAMKQYLGYYHSHFVMRHMPDRIIRALIHIYDFKGATLTQNFERYQENNDGVSRVEKYEGVALYNAERLFIYERESFSGTRIWQTVVYGTDLKTSKYLSGLTMGIATDTVRDIACYRIIYSFLGREVNLRSALAGCGTFPLESPQIPKLIRDRVINTMGPNDKAFGPKDGLV